MRKITRRIKEAFHNQESLTIDNTTTNGKAVWLFGNKIIERREDGLYATLAGWDTPTTKERLNGILDGVSVSTVRGDTYMTTREASGIINPSEWYKVR